MVVILTELAKNVVETLKSRKERAEVIQNVDLLKWEHELKPAATKLVEELDISYEDALAYVKSIDTEKGAGTFKEKLNKLMGGLKAASETLNGAMGVPQEESEEPMQQKRKRKVQPKTKTVHDIQEQGIWEPDIYIPEIQIPKW